MGEGCGVLNAEAVSKLIASAFQNKWGIQKIYTRGKAKE